MNKCKLNQPQVFHRRYKLASSKTTLGHYLKIFFGYLSRSLLQTITPLIPHLCGETGTKKDSKNKH